MNFPLISYWRADGLYRQIGGTARVRYLRQAGNAQHHGIVPLPVLHAPGGDRSGNKPGHIHAGARIAAISGIAPASQIVYDLIVDRAAIVGALMPVEITLVGSTELEEVRPLGPGEVVSNHEVLAIPEARTHVLCVEVIRSKHVGPGLALGLQRTAQTSHLCLLRQTSCRKITRPVIAHITNV